MKSSSFLKKYKYPITTFVILLSVILLSIIYWDFVSEKLITFYKTYTDTKQIEQFLTFFGPFAPVVFIGVQILQVIFAPVPGEMTGFVGGYFFGVFKGFIYSSIGLAIGSWLNFLIGRLLGKRYIRKLIPADKFNKFDQLVKRKGIIPLFILFLLPGFPKDYLCLFLGLSTLPIRAFIIMATIGRMPGTLLLSLQGTYIVQGEYRQFVLVLVICVLLALICYIRRERIYAWIEKYNGKPSDPEELKR